MCGIYTSNIVFNEKEVKTKLGSINFRGPDYMGIFQENGLSYGHLRLSILDLDERSNQPMSLDDYIIVLLLIYLSNKKVYY